jgi:hypothetical protein
MDIVFFIKNQVVKLFPNLSIDVVIVGFGDIGEWKKPGEILC